MKVQHLEFNNKQELISYAKANGMKFVNEHEPKRIIGYNEITHTLHTRKDQYMCYVVQRFDGVKYVLREADVIYFYLYRSVGDIVNLDLTELTEKTQIVTFTKRCISLTKYCPTLDGIREYILCRGLTEQFDIYNKEVHVSNKLTKNELASIEAKLNLLGVPTILVDINTILAMQKDIGKIYTTQKLVIENYVNYKQNGYIKNYRECDFIKYY
jgi:hypothetical protein